MSGNPFNTTDAGPENPREAPLTEGADRPRPPASRYRIEMRRANIVLAAMLVLAGGAVYALAVRHGPSPASAGQQTVETQVDMAILRLNETPVAGVPQAGRISRELLQNFYKEISNRQVPLKDLKKNPFVFVPVVPPPTLLTAVKQEAASPPSETPRKDSREEMMQALKKLHLQSVMMGRGGGTAIISNNLLTVGQSIDGFTVKSIAPNAVVLTWDGEEFELKMSQ